MNSTRTVTGSLSPGLNGYGTKRTFLFQPKDVTGESRFLILAKVEGRRYAAVFTKRGEAIRLISCHRADRRLERMYENYIQSEED